MLEIEPFYGWYPYYDPQLDTLSPFYGIEHSEIYYENRVYDYVANPLWENIGSDSLLLKILWVSYENGCAVIELFGVWNDLLENDFRLLKENCIEMLLYEGVNRFIFLSENVLNIYLDTNDYYEEMVEKLDEGWMCLIGAREHVKRELSDYEISDYFFYSPVLDKLKWRKLKPWLLCELVESSLRKALP